MIEYLILAYLFGVLTPSIVKKIILPKTRKWLMTKVKQWEDQKKNEP